MSAKKSLSYKDAGVDIDAGNALVERIKPLVKATHRPGVLGGIGGFGGLFELDLDNYHKPVLVAGTDGVGTKLKLAIELGNLDTVGIDLVAMCVNDVIVQGAEPLLFLDYYATGALDVDAAARVISGIAAGCRQAGAALLGGETAEMPDMYQPGDLDLAGFCVGVVERDRIIDGSQVTVGDRILGLASSGPHSNGYSLIRKILDAADSAAIASFADGALPEQLLAPTHIYVRSLLSLLKDTQVHAMAHITGGGLPENLARVLPAHCDAQLDEKRWKRPAVFDWLQAQGGITDSEMLRTFNCGIGMLVIVPPQAAHPAGRCLADAGERVFDLGEIIPGSGEVQINA